MKLRYKLFFAAVGAFFGSIGWKLLKTNLDGATILMSAICFIACAVLIVGTWMPLNPEKDVKKDRGEQ